MSIGPATEVAVRHLRGAASSLEDASARSALDDVADRAGGRFTVAVVGRLKSGKSTLVNALLGRPVAPTDSGECTRLVTRFLRGDADYVQALDDNDDLVEEIQLRNGRVSADTVRNGVARLDVYLTSGFLDDLVIVDTPGRESLDSENSARTDVFLDPGSVDAARGADAIVYVLGDPVVRAGDLDTIELFIRAAGDRHGLSTFVVLNRADQVKGGLPEAAEQAAKLVAGPLRGKIAGAVPVSAKAIQAARCGLLDTATAADLARLATIDAATLRFLTRSERTFTTAPCDVPGSIRERLNERIGLTAVRVIVEHVRNRPGDLGGAIDVLLAAGNDTELDVQLSRLRRRADGMKAAAAATTAERLALRRANPADKATILAAVSNIRASAAYSIVEQLAVLEQLRTTAGLATDVETSELERLFTPGAAKDRLPAGTDDIRGVALDGASRWQAVSSSDMNPIRQHLARVARRAYLSLLDPVCTVRGRRP